MTFSVPEPSDGSRRIRVATKTNDQAGGHHPHHHELTDNQPNAPSPFPRAGCRRCPPLPKRKRNPKYRPPTVDLEKFGRICEHFLLDGKRASGDRRPGTLIYDWAVTHTQGSVGAGLLLSLLVYYNQRSPVSGKLRLRPSFKKGLKDEDLNPCWADYLCRPYFLDYERIYHHIGLSERQVIDAVEFLIGGQFVERRKVKGHRGPVLILTSKYHQELATSGKLDGDYQPHPNEGEWCTWIYASEVIALPRLTQTLVLARWLRWLGSKGLKKRPENTHGQIAQQTGISERSVALAMKQLKTAGLLRANFVKKKIPSRRMISIPSPIHDAAGRQQLRKLTVEQLAKHYHLPTDTDLTVFWRDESVDHRSEAPQYEAVNWGVEIESLDHYEVAQPSAVSQRPEVKSRQRRNTLRPNILRSSQSAG